MRRILPFLALAMLAVGCNSSTSDANTQTVTLPANVTSLHAVSVYGGQPVIAGREASGAPVAWIRQGDSWQSLAIGTGSDAWARSIAHENGDAWYVAWHEGWPTQAAGSGRGGRVARVRAGSATDLALPAQAAGVVSVQVKDGVVYAAGDVGAGPGAYGQVWKYANGSWQGLGLSADPAAAGAGPGLAWPGIEGIGFSGTALFAWGHPATAESNGKPGPLVVLRYLDGAWTHLSAAPLSRIRSSVADGQGGFYVGGTGADALGEIWHWSGGAWTNVSPSGVSLILALAVGADGTLYCSGADAANGYRGQVWKRTGAGWKPLGLRDAREPQALAVGSDGTVYATGRDRNNVQRLWKLAP